jgi:hypothetical protein
MEPALFAINVHNYSDHYVVINKHGRPTAEKTKLVVELKSRNTCGINRITGNGRLFGNHKKKMGE